MQEENIDQSLKSRLNQRQLRKVRLGLLGVALLLLLALGSAAVTYSVLTPLAPKRPGHAQGVTARIGWYLDSGQMQVDARTLAAAFRYVMEPEPDTPTVTNFPNLPAAVKNDPSSPKS
jgi:hypothetical protein